MPWNLAASPPPGDIHIALVEKKSFSQNYFPKRAVPLHKVEWQMPYLSKNLQTKPLKPTMTNKNDINIVQDPDILAAMEASAQEETVLTESIPQPNEAYSHKDTITLEVEGQPVTRRMNDWIRYDPVTLHIAMNKVPFVIARDDFRILMSTLRANHIDYYRRAVGLDILVDINGNAQQVAARCLYNYEPAKFYKWWSHNEEKVYMTSTEKIKLFLKVESLKAGTLLKKHVEMMNRLRVPNKK